MKCDASPILALIIHVSDGAEKSPVDPIEELLSDESPSSSQPEVVQSVSTSSPTNDTGIISDSGLTIPVGTSQVRNDTQSADSDGDEEFACNLDDPVQHAAGAALCGGCRSLTHAVSFVFWVMYVLGRRVAFLIFQRGEKVKSSRKSAKIGVNIYF